MSSKVFIVDDEAVIIDVLEAYLIKNGYKVYSASNGSEALKRIKEVKPDFIILDLMLPDISGETVCREIRRESDVPIMMLTAKSDEEERIHGLVIGADDYVTKPFSPREVVVRLEAILRRTMRTKEQEGLSYNQGELLINIPRHEVMLRNEIVGLTPIEFKLLTAMAKHPGRVYSRFNLLEKIQEEYAYEGYERSIDVHIKNLRKKIEKDTRNPEYIKTVFGMGYKFGGEVDASHVTF